MIPFLRFAAIKILESKVISMEMGLQESTIKLELTDADRRFSPRIARTHETLGDRFTLKLTPDGRFVGIQEGQTSEIPLVKATLRPLVRHVTEGWLWNRRSTNPQLDASYFPNVEFQQPTSKCPVMRGMAQFSSSLQAFHNALQGR
jgi:hypothetical protein